MKTRRSLRDQTRSCPKCGSLKLVKHGMFRDEQKWRCRDCQYTTIRPSYVSYETLQNGFIPKYGAAWKALKVKMSGNADFIDTMEMIEIEYRL